MSKKEKLINLFSEFLNEIEERSSIEVSESKELKIEEQISSILEMLEDQDEKLERLKTTVLFFISEINKQQNQN